MERRSLLLGAIRLGALAPAPRAAEPAPGKRRLAVLLYGLADEWSFFPDELRAALGPLGWVEGSNLASEWRYAKDPELLRSHAAALVASAPDAILTRGTPATRALQQATKTIPILTGVGDPVGSGFARSFARPGGNITGLSWAQTETAQKQVELLRAMAPRLTTLLIVAHASRASFLSDMVKHVDI